MHRITFAANYDAINCQTIYACSSFGGLWRSIDNGEHWSNVNTDLLPFTGVADVCVNPDDTLQIFICTGYADGGTSLKYCPNWGSINPLFTQGIYRSSDYGESWDPINDVFLEDFEDGGTCRRIIINPTNPDQIFVATTLGIYRTNNATEADPNDVTWENVLSGVNGNVDLEFRGLAFHPINHDTIYASGQDIYRSINGGDSWVSLTGPTTGLDLDNLPNSFSVSRINIAVTPAQGAMDTLFAYIQGSEIVTINNKETLRTCLYIYLYDGDNWH